MAARDPMFVPRVSVEDVAEFCATARKTFLGDIMPDQVAHAIVARRVTVVADLDVTDGPIGRFIRTGETPKLSAQIWGPLYGGPMFGALPPEVALEAELLAGYLAMNVDRPPVSGWPNGSNTDTTQED